MSRTNGLALFRTLLSSEATILPKLTSYCWQYGISLGLRYVDFNGEVTVNRGFTVLPFTVALLPYVVAVLMYIVAVPPYVVAVPPYVVGVLPYVGAVPQCCSTTVCWCSTTVCCCSTLCWCRVPLYVVVVHVLPYVGAEYHCMLLQYYPMLVQYHRMLLQYYPMLVQSTTVCCCSTTLCWCIVPLYVVAVPLYVGAVLPYVGAVLPYVVAVLMYIVAVPQYVIAVLPYVGAEYHRMLLQYHRMLLQYHCMLLQYHRMLLQYHRMLLQYYRMLPKIPSPPQPPFNNYMNGQMVYGAPPMMVPPPPDAFGMTASITDEDTTGQYEMVDSYDSECGRRRKRQVVYVDVADPCKCGSHDSGCISDVSSCGNGENADSCLSDDSPDHLPASRGVPVCREATGDSHSDSSSQHSLSSNCGNGRRGNALAVPSCSQVDDRYQRVPLYGNHKGWTGSSTKSVRPLKDIPPRFKKLLAAHAQVVHKSAAFKRSQYTGAPLLKRGQVDGLNSSEGRQGVNSSGQYSFNPEAESFIPGQKYESIGHSVAPPGFKCVQPANDVVDGTAPLDTPHPTYTIHLSGGVPAYTCCTSINNTTNSDASGLTQSNAAISRSPATACSPGTIYYANQVYSAQSYMSYIPPNPSVVYNVSQQPQPAPQVAPPYMTAPFMAGCAQPPAHY